MKFDHLPDDELQTQWHDLAGRISHYHASESCDEWPKAKPLLLRLREVETEIKRRGLPRPDGAYLLADADRIYWGEPIE